ncbi:hypothetical protein ACLMJK_004227 [Lecanora helva]
MGRDPNLSSFVAEMVREMHPDLCARHVHSMPKVREAIEILLKADSDVIFLNFLLILPCLEKLGIDFLRFKRASMLRERSEGSAFALDTFVNAFLKDVYNLQRHLTPKLNLPTPKEYMRPRAEALAYADKCNIFKKGNKESSQEQARIVQRVQVGLHPPSDFSALQSDTDTCIRGTVNQEATPEQMTSHSMRSPERKLRNARQYGSRVNHACTECKRRKIKCGESPKCIYVKQGGRNGRNRTRPSGYQARSRVKSLAEVQSHSSSVSSLEIDGFGDIGIAPRDLMTSNSAQPSNNGCTMNPPICSQVSPMIDSHPFQAHETTIPEVPYCVQNYTGQEDLTFTCTNMLPHDSTTENELMTSRQAFPGAYNMMCRNATVGQSRMLDESSVFSEAPYAYYNPTNSGLQLAEDTSAGLSTHYSPFAKDNDVVR